MISTSLPSVARRLPTHSEEPLHLSRELLPAVIGAVAETSPPQPGHALYLCELPDRGGSLLLSRDGVPVVVQQGAGDLLYLYSFDEDAPAVWMTIDQRWPGATPGARFPRFHAVFETTAWGLLDLLGMDIVVRASREQIEHLRDKANQDPRPVLRRLMLGDLTAALRTADPHMAGVVAEQTLAAWRHRSQP